MKYEPHFMEAIIHYFIGDLKPTETKYSYKHL
jgi:hypothetical protein